MKETIFNSVTRFLILDKFCIKPAKKIFLQNFKIFVGLFPLNCNNTSEIKPGRNAFAVNIQMVFAFREIGKGYRSMKSFTSLMNMPPPISLRSYNRKFNHLNHMEMSLSPNK